MYATVIGYGVYLKQELPVDPQASTEQGETVQEESPHSVDGTTANMAAMTLNTESQAENTVPVRKLCLPPLAHSRGSILTLSSPHLCCLAQVELSVVLRPATFSFAPGTAHPGSPHKEPVNENGSAYPPPSYQSDMSGFDVGTIHYGKYSKILISLPLISLIRPH